MHLKTCPKFVHSELRLEASGFSAPSHRGALFMSHQGVRLRTCSSNHGNNHVNIVTPLPGGENNGARLIQSAATNGDAPLDVWTVIRPGHVREKIAIFASEEGRGGGGASTGGSCDQTQAPWVNRAMVTGLSRAPKAKGSWELNCSAKRRRRSGNNRALLQNSRTQEGPQHAIGPPPHQPDGELALEEEQKVSVGEMVAFLEQRASEQPKPKPLLGLQRSSASITLSKAPPPEPRKEGPESLRVSDMVARLESECLKRSEGGVSRSNSLRRTVGRVLIAAADQSPASCAPSPAAVDLRREPMSCQETVQTESPASALPGAALLPEAPPSTEAPPLHPEEAEPPPGLLFMSMPPPAQTRPPGARPLCDSSNQSEKRSQCGPGQEAGPLGRRASASQDFLQLRQRVQQLLQPQPFLWALPHHLLLHILCLLPTHSLAALKCTCSYFKVVMETYGVRPIDSLWVSDPRYRDDPCKQCKRRYWRGDVSLCRWHHKPFCQALPGGPGYWMCCRGNRRDAPGCNAGLHDNRWVPAFHSINAPIRRSSNHND